MDYLFYGISLQNGRQSNMDSLLLKRGRIGNKNALLGVVCDGVGSLSDGAVASVTAVRMLSEWFNNTEAIDRFGMRMRDAILEINACIMSEANRNDLDTASTLSALFLIEKDYYIAHIGDSRIYCYENETLSRLTSDDVSKSGKLTAYIGRTKDIFLQYSEGDATGKTFLLCSDGLYKRMDEGFMIEKMTAWNRRSLKEPIEAMSRYVIKRGEHDNISLALVKTED